MFKEKTHEDTSKTTQTRTDTSHGNKVFFQPKLSVNQPGDAHEQEADAMADRVMKMDQSAGSAPVSATHAQGCGCSRCAGSGPNVQRQEKEDDDQTAGLEEAGGNHEADEAREAEGSAPDEAASEQKEAGGEVMQKPEASGTATGGYAAPPQLAAQLADTKSGGQHLPSDTRATMEHSMGANFSGVRIHTDDRAAEMSEGIQAKAFTHEKDIYFNQGQYAPETTEGKRLLAHELAHVTQQNTGGTVRRFFGKIWKGVKKAAGWVGDKVKKGVQAIGKGASWLGGKIASGAKKAWEGIKWLGNKVWTGAKWVGKQLFDKFAAIFHRVGRWITNLPARVGRLFTGLWEGLKTFKPWTLSWWKSLGKADTWKNFLKWAGGRLLDVLEIMGIGEVYETLMDFIKFNTRSLNGAERALASSVFGASINLDLVRIDEAAIIGPAFSGRAYTSFHTINNWGKLDNETLIHELTHVWQYERAGAVYMPQAIHAQVWGEGYTYGGAAGLKKKQNAGQGYGSLNREQQAEVVQDFYLLKTSNKTHDTSNNPATKADLPLYADFVVSVSTLSKGQLLAV